MGGTTSTNHEQQRIYYSIHRIKIQAETKKNSRTEGVGAFCPLCPQLVNLKGEKKTNTA